LDPGYFASSGTAVTLLNAAPPVPTLIVDHTR
jgi:hypothetical protein